MIRVSEKYIEKRKLKVDVARTKVMRFRKGEGRSKIMEFKCKGKRT